MISRVPSGDSAAATASPATGGSRARSASGPCGQTVMICGRVDHTQPPLPAPTSVDPSRL
jgi:hypothetical protein